MNSDTGRLSRHARWTALAGVLALVLLAAIAPRSLTAQGTPLNLTFGPGRDATQPGTVVLTPQGDQTLVVINVGPNPAGNGADQAAHIHTGLCPGVGAVQYPLTNVVDGKSTTTVNVALNAVLDGNHSINVHQGTAAPASGIYTACVNLPASGGASASAAAPSGAPAATGAAAPAQATPARPVTPPATVAPQAPRPVPSAPNTGVGPGPARQSSAPSPAQVTVAASPQLPSTGTGGLLTSSQSPFEALPFVLLAIVLLMPAGVLALRRDR
jgi:hypothetical protein